MTAPHSPLDSLTYLYASVPTLDWISEELGGAHGDEPDLEQCINMIDSYVDLIRTEIDHHGRRNTYSTGHPVRVERKHRQVEPDPDGGFNRIVWVPYLHTCTPAGTVIGDPDDSP